MMNTSTIWHGILVIFAVPVVAVTSECGAAASLGASLITRRTVATSIKLSFTQPAELCELFGETQTEQKSSGSFGSFGSWGNTTPVAFLWFGPAQLPDYFALTLTAAAMKNPVIVLTDLSAEEVSAFVASLPSHRKDRVFFVDMAPFAEPSASFFAPGQSSSTESFYHPMGSWEPYQGNNFRRHFVILELMRATGIYSVFLADCDVVLFADVNAERLRAWPPEKCSATMFLEPDLDYAWAGSTYLSRPLLEEFVKFIDRVYSPEHVGALQELHARDNLRVGDMVIWGIFFGMREGFNKSLFSAGATEGVCNNNEIVDGRQFHGSYTSKLPGFKILADGTASYWNVERQERIQLLSAHFAGDLKDQLSTELAPMLSKQSLA